MVNSGLGAGRRVAITAASIVLLLIAMLTPWHPRLLARIRGFTPARAFPLPDSLPALAGGLRDLEAFRFTAGAGLWTDPDRSVWLADSIGDLEIEYWTEKPRLDSVELYLWTSDSLMEVKRLRGDRAAARHVPYHKRIGKWVEAVGVYASYPPVLELRHPDSTVVLFQRVEGVRIHLVSGVYPRRRERALPPDISYQASIEALSGGLQLLARKGSLAVINPSPRPIRLKVGRFGNRTWAVCETPPRRVNVYRNLLPRGSGPFLAYTDPGRPFYGLAGKNRVETAYYLLSNAPLR